MRFIWVFCIVACFFMMVVGCGQNTGILDNKGIKNTSSANNKTNSSVNDLFGNLTGIRFSQWYMSEKYQRDIIDIMNFDNVERTINITTKCFDTNGNLIPSNDSEVLKIPPKNMWTWIPMCPDGTVSYTLDMIDLDKKKE